MTILFFIILGFGLLGYYLWLKVQPTPKKEIDGDLGIDWRLEENIQDLTDKYNPDEGAISAWFRKIQSDARGEYLKSLNAEQIEVLRQASILQNALKDGKKSSAELKTFIAEHVNTFLVLEEASRLRLPPEIYGEIEKHRQMTQITLDSVFAEQREAIRLAILSESMTEHQKLFLAQELLDAMYKQIDEIENGTLSDDIKARMIQDRESVIVTLKEDRHARQERLLQTSNGQEV